MGDVIEIPAKVTTVLTRRLGSFSSRSFLTRRIGRAPNEMIAKAKVPEEIIAKLAELKADVMF